MYNQSAHSPMLKTHETNLLLDQEDIEEHRSCTAVGKEIRSKPNLYLNVFVVIWVQQKLNFL